MHRTADITPNSIGEDPIVYNCVCFSLPNISHQNFKFDVMYIFIDIWRIIAQFTLLKKSKTELKLGVCAL